MDATTKNLIYTILNDALEYNYGLNYIGCERIVFDMLYNSISEVCDISDIVSNIIGNHINKFIDIRYEYNKKYISDTKLIRMAMGDISKNQVSYILSIIQQGDVDKDTIDEYTRKLSLYNIIDFNKYYDTWSPRLITIISADYICKLLIDGYSIDNNNNIKYFANNYPTILGNIFDNTKYYGLPYIDTIRTEAINFAVNNVRNNNNNISKLFALIAPHIHITIPHLSNNNTLIHVINNIISYLYYNKQYLTSDIIKALRSVVVYPPIVNIIHKITHLSILDGDTLYAMGVYIGILTSDVDKVDKSIDNIKSVKKYGLEPLCDDTHIYLSNKLLAKCTRPILDILYTRRNILGDYAYKIGFLLKNRYCHICNNETANLFIPPNYKNPEIHSCKLVVCNKCVKIVRNICPSCNKPYVEKVN